MPPVSTDFDQERLRVQLGGKILRNDELIREHFAMKDFIDNLTESIKMQQYVDKDSAITKLGNKTADCFFMKEQQLISPEQHQKLLDADDSNQQAQRIVKFIETHRTMPRYHEDLQKVEHQVRDKITNSVKLPKRHQDKLLEIKQRVILEQEEQKMQALKDAKNTETKLKQKPSISKQMRDKKEMDRLRLEKILREQKPEPLKMPKQAQYENNVQLKAKIRVGEPIFKREQRHDQIRIGYETLMSKLSETQRMMNQIKNGKTIFESDLMRVRYANPFVGHPQTTESLQKYMHDTRPKQDKDECVNFLEEWREPLFSQGVGTDPKTQLASTETSWMPKGAALKDFAESINENLQTASRIQDKSHGATTSYFDLSSRRQHSVFGPSTAVSPRGETREAHEQRNASVLSRQSNARNEPVDRSKTDILIETWNNLNTTRLSTRGNEESLSLASKDQEFSTLQPPHSLQKRDKQAMKGISFPISPSFVHNYNTAKAVKLKPAQKVCTENNIPFCAEEDKFYKLKQNKTRFKSFEKAMNSCYENKRPHIVDVGMSILEESELQPPADQVSTQYDDLRQYVPDLALKSA